MDGRRKSSWRGRRRGMTTPTLNRLEAGFSFSFSFSLFAVVVSLQRGLDQLDRQTGVGCS